MGEGGARFGALSMGILLTASDFYCIFCRILTSGLKLCYNDDIAVLSLKITQSYIAENLKIG